MDQANKLTYELLFDMLRNEKNREELQALDKNFFADLIDYIQDKERLIKDNSDNQLFSGLEREKTLKQLENAKKLIKELYERREKKVLNLAMISSRTGGILDKSAMLPEEQKLFETLSKLLEEFRNDILYRVIGGNMPELREQIRSIGVAGVAADSQTPSQAHSTPGKDTVLVRFIHAVPKFIGKELEIYGPFESEDIANLPKQIADILVTKGRAELMKA
jgi:DNA replication initiation complex subunit (GINS family)